MPGGLDRSAEHSLERRLVGGYRRDDRNRPTVFCNLQRLARLYIAQPLARVLMEFTHPDSLHVLFVALSYKALKVTDQTRGPGTPGHLLGSAVWEYS